MEREQLKTLRGRKTHNLPNGWEMKELSTVCEKILDGTHFSPKSKDGPFRYLTSKNIRNDGLDLNNCNYISEEEHRDIFKRCPVQFGDLLLTKDGANTGNCCQNTLKEEFSLLSSVAVLKAADGKVDNSYLLQSLKSPRGQFEIKDAMAGQAITRITLEKIKNFIFPFPPLSQQRKIAAILSTWDEAIKTADQLLKAKQVRKRGLMQKLLTKQKRLQGFAGEWREVQLGEVFSERNETKRSHLPLLAITASNGVVMRNTLEKRDTSNEDKGKYLRICPGDIGYNTMRMWQGVSGVSQYEGLISPAYTVLIPAKSVDVNYMAYLFKYQPMIHLFWRYSQGLVDDTLNCKYDSFRRIHVTIPLIEEQRAITEVLNAADEEIQLAKAEVEALKQQKRGLMQQLLTGRKLVMVDEREYQYDLLKSTPV